jgi:hypothetical protein
LFNGVVSVERVLASPETIKDAGRSGRPIDLNELRKTRKNGIDWEMVMVG